MHAVRARNRTSPLLVATLLAASLVLVTRSDLTELVRTKHAVLAVGIGDQALCDCIYSRDEWMQLALELFGSEPTVVIDFSLATRRGVR